MSDLINTIELRPPYLLFLGDVADHIDAKTALGIAFWRPELCIGQCRLGSPVDTGMPDMTPSEAASAGRDPGRGKRLPDGGPIMGIPSSECGAEGH